MKLQEHAYEHIKILEEAKLRRVLTAEEGTILTGLKHDLETLEAMTKTEIDLAENDTRKDNGKR